MGRGIILAPLAEKATKNVGPVGSLSWETMVIIIWVCLKMVSTPKPNGFADQISLLNGYFIGNINPIFRQTHILHEFQMIRTISSWWFGT